MARGNQRDLAREKAAKKNKGKASEFLPKFTTKSS